MSVKVDKIVRSKRKTLSLIVNAEGELIVRAPLKTPAEFIEGFIEKKTSWILDKQAMMKEKNKRHLVKKLQDGESLLYLGECYRLTVTEEVEKITVAKDYLLVPSSAIELKQAIIAWYYLQSFRVFTERLNYYSHITGLNHQSLKISNATKRWGSCSNKGSINLSWRLVMCPLPVVDYVVIHELSHLKHLNHSKDFWNIVRAIMPDYEEHRKWLKDNANILDVI
jgi:predicted metal-dependent hydrolase